MKEQKKGNPGAGHYEKMGVDPIEVMKRLLNHGWAIEVGRRWPYSKVAFASWNTCNALKYVMRYPFKGGTEDIRKAIYYLEALLAEFYESEAKEGPPPAEVKLVPLTTSHRIIHPDWLHALENKKQANLEWRDWIDGEWDHQNDLRHQWNNDRDEYFDTFASYYHEGM